MIKLLVLLITTTMLHATLLTQDDLVNKIGGVAVLRDTPMETIKAFRNFYKDEKNSKENIEFLNQQFADYVGFGTLEKKNKGAVT